MADIVGPIQAASVKNRQVGHSFERVVERRRAIIQLRPMKVK